MMLRKKPKILLPNLEEDTIHYIHNTLNVDYNSAECKLLVYQLNQILNYDDYKKCRSVNPVNVIGEGSFGTIYKSDDDPSIIYKKSKTFNKLIDYMKKCDQTNKKIISLLMIVLEIPKTNEKIKEVVNKSKLIKHFNIPDSC